MIKATGTNIEVLTTGLVKTLGTNIEVLTTKLVKTTFANTGFNTGLVKPSVLTLCSDYRAGKNHGY